MMNKTFRYYQQCINIKTGEIFMRNQEVSGTDISSNGFSPDINGLYALLNKWNGWSFYTAHPELRWFYYTEERDI